MKRTFLFSSIIASSTCGSVSMAFKVHKENIFPRCSLHGTGFDLCQVDPSVQRKPLRPGRVRPEYEELRRGWRSYPFRFFCDVPCPRIKKARVIVGIIFNPGLDDFQAILFGGRGTGNGCHLPVSGRYLRCFRRARRLDQRRCGESFSSATSCIVPKPEDENRSPGHLRVFPSGREDHGISARALHHRSSV